MTTSTYRLGQCEECDAVVFLYNTDNSIAFHDPGVNRPTPFKRFSNIASPCCRGSGMPAAALLECIGDVSGAAARSTR